MLPPIAPAQIALVAPAPATTNPAPRYRPRATRLECHTETCDRRATWKLWIRRTLTNPDDSSTTRIYFLYACRGCSRNARTGMTSRRRGRDGSLLITTLLDVDPLPQQH